MLPSGQHDTGALTAYRDMKDLDLLQLGLADCQRLLTKSAIAFGYSA